MDQETELEAFKREIDLRDFAASLGYAMDRRESWRGSTVLRRRADKIVVKRNGNGRPVPRRAVPGRGGPPFGANLRYCVRHRDRELACLLWTSPAWKMRARDEWIGWSDAQRRRNLQAIVNNGRFLILAWVQVKGLARDPL